ncbi:hypothetical protein BG015_009119 [Linnemannia schmuckeri]|uniref:Major facilitator superfamily (MFS) profile domain-containing protein n=1 Tax=Linnemannia schmuckeri TaxID=64567 RepID=A0A9P5RVZ9_9FUNG|nr:hypothetical protein BG015_009119 [Linnemannia schmuckeri]
MKAEIDAVHQHTPQPLQKQEVKDERINVEEKQPQTKLSAFQEKMAPLMLFVVSMAQFIDIMNGSSMTVALVDISEALGFDSYSTQWIISAYVVTFGGFLLLSGRIGDMYGHRRVFLTGQIWFGIWSLVISFSTSPAMFCTTRALQGIGASMSVPTALGLITTTFPAGPKRTRALSVFGGFGAAGAVVGLLLAGAFISSVGWEWIFRFSSIFSFLLFAIGYLAIPVAAPKLMTTKIDVAGAMTATSSMICIIYYISTGSATGWASVQTLPVLIAGLVLLTAFFWIETRLVKNPIMPFRIWRLKNFSSAFVAILFLQGQFQGFTYFTTLTFQNVMGYTSMQTALAFLAHSLFAVVAFTVLGKILPKYRLKPFILTGFAFRCVAALMFAFVHSTTSYWTLPFLGLLVHVIGLGTSVLPAQITALKDAQNENQGVVGALYSTGMQLGAPLGLVIVTLISENSVDVTVGTPVEEVMKSYRNGLFGIVALGVLGAIVTAFMMPNTAPAPSGPAPIPAPVTDSADAAIATGTVAGAAGAAGAGTAVVDLELDEVLAEAAEKMEMV